jgi:hypothetical protein
MGGIKIAAATVRDVMVGLFSSPFFFMLLGSAFIVASYAVLTKVGRCGQRVLEFSCLQLSQLNLIFGLLATLLGAALLIYGMALHATQQEQVSGVKQVYDEIKSFFGSPVFFIALGTLFLYCALVLLDETHSGFVFILAVLGIAMILFGTGSQGIVSGELPQGTAGKLSVGIAGGAAALAAIFGFGIVHLEPGIQDFFKRTIDYGFLELTTVGTANQTLDLDEQIVNASTADGRPLHLWKQTGRMQIMVPRYSRQGAASVVVIIRGPRIPPNSPPMTYTVDWQGVQPLTTSGNERIYIARQSMTSPLAPATSLQVDESGQTLPPVTIPPPQ